MSRFYWCIFSKRCIYQRLSSSRQNSNFVQRMNVANFPCLYLNFGGSTYPFPPPFLASPGSILPITCPFDYVSLSSYLKEHLCNLINMISKTTLFTLLTASLSLVSPVKALSDVLDLTSADFADTLKENNLVLAEFFAPWVGRPSKLTLIIVWSLQSISTRIWKGRNRIERQGETLPS